MQLRNVVNIIGWGNVPVEPRFTYSNERVLGMIESNLLREGQFEKAAEIHLMTQESVRAKLGIEQRQYIWDKITIELALIAAENALMVAAANDSNFSREKVHLIISGGSTPDDLYPSCAAQLQNLLGIPDAEAFDVSAACCSGTQALIEAVRALQVGSNVYTLVVTAEKIGSWCNNRMDENALLWGDGASAVVVQSNNGGNRNYGVLNFLSRSDGRLAGTTRSRGIGAHPDHRTFPALNASMEGRGPEIYGWVIGPVAAQLKQFVADSGITVDERTFLLPHNGNLRMVHKVGQAIGIAPERVLNCIAERGNQSSASVFSTLAHYADQDFFKHDDQLIFATFGGGVAYNFVLYRWL